MEGGRQRTGTKTQSRLLDTPKIFHSKFELPSGWYFIYLFILWCQVEVKHVRDSSLDLM